MKAIGLVTFWDGNYGSALQCYSLKKIISSLGYRCDLLEEKHTGLTSKFTRILKKIIWIPYKTLRYPQFGKAYLELRRHAKLANDAISVKTQQDIHFFGITTLQPKELSRKALNFLGHSDEYVAFITGSDQVWGGHFVDPTYGNFLEFAPINKRISYAASFGSKYIAKYNLKKYKLGIKGINKISVRENIGIEIVKKLTGRTAIKMPDPTVLLSADEWVEFCKSVNAEQKPYILVHFLDKISDNAINVIKILSEYKKIKILCLGWKRKEILSLKNSFFVDGDPKKYISLINNADYICTDSFHTTIFSMMLCKQFYTFPRCYAHSFHQSSRITDLLNDTNCKHRYIINYINFFDELPNDSISCSNFFNTQRNIGINFIKNSIPKYENVINRLKDDNECSGCGVCAEKCPSNAIYMKHGEKGYLLPNINPNFCIQCGICETYCKSNIIRNMESKNAYIAFSNDKELRLRSASGGLFSSIAKQFILHGGTVYGAVLEFKNSKTFIEHHRASTIDELYPLLQSKYVQSNAISCFNDVLNHLLSGHDVLFSGTSCQIDALYRFLGKDYSNLYTLDLICHGVPGDKFFSDFIDYIEKKYNSKVISFSFREKEDGKIEYIQSITFENGLNVKTSVDNSEYYKLFFSSDSYRECCYNCKFASLDKPADITAGDYFNVRKDYPELFNREDSILNTIDGLSCCIVHSSKGKKLISYYGNDLLLIPADVRKIQESHSNLCYPSLPSDLRNKIMHIYKHNGFVGIHMFFLYRKPYYTIINKTKKILRKLLYK